MNVYKVGKILDRYTLVVVISADTTEARTALANLTGGTRMAVLGVGGTIPGLDVPLVVPKGTVKVKANLGSYVVVESDETTEAYRETGLDLLIGRAPVRTTNPLRVRETEMSGNPGRSEISVGDPVVEYDDIGAYAEMLAKQKSGAQ